MAPKDQFWFSFSCLSLLFLMSCHIKPCVPLFRFHVSRCLRCFLLRTLLSTCSPYFLHKQSRFGVTSWRRGNRDILVFGAIANTVADEPVLPLSVASLPVYKRLVFLMIPKELIISSSHTKDAICSWNFFTRHLATSVHVVGPPSVTLIKVMPCRLATTTTHARPTQQRYKETR